MTMLQIRKLKAFGNQIYAEATRDLNLLRNIENTLDALDVHCERLRQANQAADHFIKLLKESDSPLMSGDVDLLRLFESGRDSLGAAYDVWGNKHVCAINAPELSDEDGVVEAYALLLTEVAALHDKLNTLCWIIREQEADQDVKLSGEFSSADDLFAAMGV